ncbi:MAG: MFS transporter, partial [Solirubrobacteraceae bacterium]
STIFAAGAAWWALAIGLAPDYAGELLGGMVLTGIGVGLTLPTLMATGASSLPPHAFATGSAVVNMLRQVGLALGVAALIAVLGTPHSPPETLIAYQRATWMVAAIAFLGGILGLGLLAARRLPSPTAAGADTIAPAVAIATSGEGPRR